MKLLLTLALITLNLSAFGNSKVIYGTDNRMEVLNSPAIYQHWAKSTAAMVSTHNIKIENGEYVLSEVKTLEQRGICSDERFANQLAPAKCSGFLISPDLLVTAGHCVWNKIGCNVNYWIFDYQLNSDGTSKSKISSDNLYRCKEVVARAYEPQRSIDYAVLKLDRPVTNRTFLKLRQAGKVPDSTPVIVIGHPSGISTKITDSGEITNNAGVTSFFTNLDTFEGNSGSPVINSDTGFVEGIFVYGDMDYYHDDASNCKRPRRCTYFDMNCLGEEASRISNIQLPFLNQQ